MNQTSRSLISGLLDKADDKPRTLEELSLARDAAGEKFLAEVRELFDERRSRLYHKRSLESRTPNP